MRGVVDHGGAVRFTQAQIRGIEAKPRRRVPWWGLAATGPLVLLLMAGSFKGSAMLSSFPVDLTVFAALLVAGAALAAWIRADFPLPTGIGWVGLLFFLMLPGVILSESNPYGSVKVASLYTFTLLCVLAPMLLVRSNQRRALLLGWIAAFGVAFAFLATFVDPSLGDAGVDRLTLDGANPIEAGRTCGAALIVMVLVGLRRRRWLVVNLLGLGLLATLLFGSGSRGPLLAAGAALIITVVLARGERKTLRIGGTLVVLGAFVWFGYRTAPEATISRLEAVATGDDSTQGRLWLLEDAWTVIGQHPLGIGWGDFLYYMRPGVVLDSGFRQYPHNLFLEITAEAGWLAGAAFIVVLLVAFRRAYQGAADMIGSALFALLIFSTLNALVSADVNGNRMLFVLIGVCLATPRNKVGNSLKPTGREQQVGISGATA